MSSESIPNLCNPLLAMGINTFFANLTAENIMLETRLEMAEKKLTNLMSKESEVMDAGTFEEEPQEEEK